MPPTIRRGRITAKRRLPGGMDVDSVGLLTVSGVDAVGPLTVAVR
jgi:hypothetical protein